MASNDDPNKQKPQRSPADANNLEGLGMDELLNLYDQKMATFAEGEIVRGRVVKVTSTEVVVDIGYKSEGLLPINQVTGYDGEVRVKRGDEIDVFVERLEDVSGYVQLSREKAERMLVWDRIEAAYKADEPITGRVVDRVKGGLSVDETRIQDIDVPFVDMLAGREAVLLRAGKKRFRRVAIRP